MNTTSALAYQGRRFNAAESDYEIWLRADELGLALAVDPPEQAVLDIHQTNLMQFSERLSILTPVETAEGPRLMRAFNLLGAYVLSTFAPNPPAQQFRRWLLETLIYFQIDIRREIEKLKEEDRRLREYFEAAIQTLAEEVRALREAYAARNDRDWMEGEFRRWHDAQAETAATVKKLSTRIGTRESRRDAALEDIAALLRACVDPLADGVADLHERLDALPAGGSAALGDGVPVLALPSHYSLAFQSDHGDRLTVQFWSDSGPWFLVLELADLLAPPEGALRDIGGFVSERVPAAHRATARDSDGSEVLLVTETGLVLLFRAWTESMPDFDKGRLGGWIADRVIPSALSLRLRETQLEPERRPKDFPAAPTEVLADGLFKVYAGDLDGRAAALVKARDLYKFLGFRRSYSSWFDERSQWAGFRNGVHYLRPFVASFRYEHYLTLDAAGSLLCQESHPRAIEARDYLLEVARERAGVIEGEAVRVEETATSLPAFPAFPDDGLVTVRQGEIGGKTQPVVDARELHGFLQVATRFDDWIRRRLREYDFIEGKDFVQIFGSSNLRNQKGRGGNRKATIDYHLTLDVAEELAMVENNDMGRKVRRYFIKCEKLVLAWREEILACHEQAAAKANAQLALVSLHDTPPHQPLAIPFKRGSREIPIRVAVRGGRSWFLAFDVALAVDGESEDPRPAFAGVPDAYRNLWPSPDGESAALWVDEAGLAYYLGGRPHQPAAEALRDWLQGAARAALRNRPGAVPTGLAEASAPIPPHALPRTPVPEADRNTYRDPLVHAFLALARILIRVESRMGTGAVSENYGRVLAWLWRHPSAGEWIDVGSALRFSATLGIERRSLTRTLGRLQGWGLVERNREPAGGGALKIRLVRDRVEVSLRAAGLALPE